MEMSGIDRARELARFYHHGQRDKLGVPYIEHVERVANSPLLETDEQRQAAWLHDIVEDTAISLHGLIIAGISIDVVEAVKALTHATGEPRREYIDRIRANPIALAVKMADNRDNYSRNSDLPAGEVRDRLRVKYEREWEWLNAP